MEFLNRSPLPKTQLVLLCFLRLLDPLNFSQIFPYVNELIVHLHVAANPSKIGFYSGLLESSFAACQLLAIYPWGFLSDNIGRRPVILLGVVGLAVSTVSFGLSQNYLSALVSRALAGLFSGNVAVIPSILCEITDGHNQAIAFAFFGLWWPLGGIIGPLLGGNLVNPASRWPLFSDSRFFRTYPCFLPSIVVAAITVIVFAFSFAFLKESRLPSAPHIQTIRRAYSATDDVRRQARKVTAFKLLSLPVIVTLCLSGCVLSFVSTSFDVIFVLFCYYPIHKGGLGLTAAEIGFALALSGAIAASIQILVLPTLLRRYDHAELYHGCMKIWPCVLLCLPSLNILVRLDSDGVPKYALWGLMGVLLLCMRVAFLAYSINMLLIKENSNPSTLGSTYALVQFFICLSRAVSPALASMLFTFCTEMDLLQGYSWSVVMGICGIGGCLFSRKVVIECKK